MFEKIRQEVLDSIVMPDIRYKKPFIIALCGYSGTGKTTLCKFFSSKFGLYILGGDRIRSLFYSNDCDCSFEEINSATDKIFDEELDYLLNNGVSIIIDRSISSQEALKKLRDKCENIITINILSSDEENISRLYAKKNGQNIEYNPDGVYGDYRDYSGMKNDPENLYFEVKNRKVYDITDFDFEIDSLCSFDDFLDNAGEVSKRIEKRLNL